MATPHALPLLYFKPSLGDEPSIVINPYDWGIWSEFEFCILPQQQYSFLEVFQCIHELLFALPNIDDLDIFNSILWLTCGLIVTSLVTCIKPGCTGHNLKQRYLLLLLFSWWFNLCGPYWGNNYSDNNSVTQICVGGIVLYHLHQWAKKSLYLSPSCFLHQFHYVIKLATTLECYCGPTCLNMRSNPSSSTPSLNSIPSIFWGAILN